MAESPLGDTVGGKGDYQFSSVAQSCLTLCNSMKCSTPCQSITNCQSLHKFMFTESVMLPNHLIICCPLLLLPSITKHQDLFK